MRLIILCTLIILTTLINTNLFGQCNDCNHCEGVMPSVTYQCYLPDSIVISDATIVDEDSKFISTSIEVCDQYVSCNYTINEPGESITVNYGDCGLELCVFDANDVCIGVNPYLIINYSSTANTCINGEVGASFTPCFDDSTQPCNQPTPSFTFGETCELTGEPPLPSDNIKRFRTIIKQSRNRN